MEIPILNGIYTDNSIDYRTKYPVNMIPTIENTGVSGGYLRPVEGIVETGEGPGTSRGAINWRGTHYRVMGDQLCSIDSDGVVTQLGNVDNNLKPVTFTYSFDRLAVASAEKLFYWDEATLTQVTDPDLGTVLDVTWIDGYFMTTDGEFLVVTELNDPTQVSPTKYGSSEIDPDPVQRLLKLRNNVYAVNRYTIEAFNNVGGTGFPFQRIEGAQIQRGALGTYCAIVYEETITFLGSGRNEAPGIYMGVNADTVKISTKEIDLVLQEYTEEQLADSELETLNYKGHALLWVKIPDRTLVYDITASQMSGQPVWYVMSSDLFGFAQYRAQHVIYCYDEWQVGDTQSAKIGILDDTLASHFGDTVRWEFTTGVVYNGSKGALINRLELVALTGRVAFGTEPTVGTSYSKDGQQFSQTKFVSVGTAGERLKRLVWWRQGNMQTTRTQKFIGTSDTYVSIARLEAEIEPLRV